MGCHARHLPAYIIALVGGGFVCLNWLIPSGQADVPLVAVFKRFDGAVVLALVLMGAQIAAAVICFTTTRKQSAQSVADKSMLSLKLFLGSFIALILIVALYGLYTSLTGSGIPVDIKFGDKIKLIFVGLTLLIKFVTLLGGILIAAPIAGSCLLARLMRR